MNDIDFCKEERKEIEHIIGSQSDSQIKNEITYLSSLIVDVEKEVGNLSFGYIKRVLNGGYFLLRGLEKVNAEASLFCTCFNLRRMITLLGGVRPMIEKLKITV